MKSASEYQTTGILPFMVCECVCNQTPKLSWNTRDRVQSKACGRRDMMFYDHLAMPMAAPPTIASTKFTEALCQRAGFMSQ